MNGNLRQTKKLTVSAMAVALGVVFMALGFFVEVLDLTAAALCSLVMVFMFIEIGSPYTFMTWLATTLLGFIFFQSSFVWITYGLVFGIYPIVKAYIERLRKRVLWLPLKLAYGAVTIYLLAKVSELLFGIPLVASDNKIFLAAVYAGLIVAFILYDICITVCVRTYFARFRQRISKLLK